MKEKFGNIVNEYYVKRFREIAKGRQQRIDSIKTRKQALDYIHEVRTKIRNCFALDQEERTPLNAKITATHEMKSYTLECVVFESHPGYYVTANLYLPKRAKRKIPAVLLLCGHNLDAKSCASYAIFSAHLAVNGMAVLIVDPVCQGERFQFQGKDQYLENVHGHNMLGKKLIAYGDFFGAWRAFDAVRSVDYLLTRQEIDPEKIYAAGCSGGGTLTTWLTALDDRLAGAVPSCFITTWVHDVENELPSDAEQTPPDIFGAGIEMADFLIAAAPRYLHISGEQNDFFDPRGGHETFEEVQKFYKLLSAEEKISCFFGPNGHGMRAEQRDAACRKLCQWSAAHKKYLPETEVETAPAEFKYAAPNGSVFNIPGNLSALELLRQRAGEFISVQKPLKKNELKQIITSLLKIPAKISIPYFRILRGTESKNQKHFVSRFLLEENEIPLAVLGLHSNSAIYYHIPEGNKCLLYIPHWDSGKELMKFAKDEVQSGIPFSLDPFGIGEMTPVSCYESDRKFGASYSFDYHYASCGMMLGEPYMGMRVRGILAAIHLLHSCGYTDITLAGAGQSSVLAACASLLADNKVRRTILINPLESYESILDKPTRWPQSGFIPGILKYTDLPQLYKMIHAEIRGTYFHQLFK